MSQKKFLDKIGLQNFLNRIKALIPTKTSELQNDSGFITSEGAYDSALSLESEKAVQNKVVTAAINGKQDSLSTAQTNAVNSGITSAKVQGYDSHISDTDIHVTQADKTSWDSKASGTHTHLASEVSGLSTVATSGSYNDLSNKPSIPSKTSDLTNDSGFLTSHNPVDSALSSTSTNAVQNKVINNALTGKSDTGHTHLASEVSGLSTVATSGSYSDLTNKPTIDSALSSTSTNAVQNKVINTELGKKANTTDLATVATSGSYNDLSNKPTIPTVYNKTLTIQQNGTTVKTFTANSNADVTANITVPTKTSDLTNDSGYLTAHQSLADYSTKADTIKDLSISGKVITYTKGDDTTGTLTTQDTVYTHPTTAGNKHIPSGGSANQYLKYSASGTAQWATIKTSELNNDSGFLTSHNPVDSALSTTSENAVQNKVVKAELDLKANSADLSTVATTGNYTDLNNIPSNFTPASHTHGSITNDGKLGTASRALITDGNKKIAVSSVTSTELGYLSGVTSAVQDQLDGKAASTHSHTASEVSGLATVATSGSYNDLANKPTIPTVNNATLTIQKNGTTVKTFTANASANVTANITVPTKVSELTNDSGFLTSHNPVDSALSDTSTNAVQNKVVKGALDGKSDTGHTHTKSEITDFPTLATVATSGSYNDLSNKPTIPTVNNATLTIQKNGTTVKTFTANASSNVTANITVPTKVSELTNDSGFLTSASNLDSSKLTGTIDIARLPKGALERLVTVADQTARFALTTSDVQLGDTVKQLDTGVMYIVTDESKLSSADGYTEYTAGAATSVPWSGVTGKPSSYTPASHSHGNIANGGTLGTASRALITDGNKKITTSSVTSTELGYVSGVTSAIQTQLDGKALSSHTHTASEVSGLSTVATSGSYNDLSNKPTIDSALSSTSTNAVQNKVINSALAGKAASSHTHTKSQITDFPTKTSQFTNDSHQTITVGTDTTSTASPAHSGTFTCIDSVTRDSNGHVTAVNTKTVTLPSDNNTDTLVTQNVSTANENHPVLLTVTKDATANQGAKTSIFASGVKVNPSTNTVTATTFSGALSGNASTATQFSANKAVTLTGDVTGTASSKAGWSVATTLSDSGVTAGTYGPSADVTGNNNATISVPEITVDSKGRVTSVANRTLTCKNNTYNVYNKTLTIQKNGTNVATFTSNSNTDVTANITVPTKVSELTNDSGYLTSHQSLSNYVTLNGNQTITGAKTFQSGGTSIGIKATNHEKGVIPSGNQHNIIQFTDKNGVQTGFITKLKTSGYSCIQIASSDLYKNNAMASDGTNVGAVFTVGTSTKGVPYWQAPMGAWESIYPHNERTTLTLGTSTNKWSNVYATAFTGNLTGNVTGNVTGNCSGSSGSCTGLAAKATGNANGKELTNTIIKGLSISGKTITYTQIDGTTGTLTTQDNNTWTAMVGATSSANGSVGYVNAVPPKDGYNTKYLRADGTWAVPPDHTYTVNNATLTIQKNGTNVATFTSNASANATANITVPTKTSELTNDSGFLTSHQSLSNYVTLNSAQTISATKTWTKSQSFKNTAITNHKANPSADTEIWACQFWSNDNKYWGGLGHKYLTTGFSEVQLCMSNWTTSGSQGYWHIDFGAAKDFSSVYFRPSGNNNIYLGTSDKKWANVYATTFTGNLTGNVTGNCSGSSGSCTGNAATATQFSANKSVTLTGYINGTASSKAGWSIATALKNCYFRTGGTVTNTYFKVASGTLTGGWNRYETLIRFVELTGNASCTLRVYLQLNGSSLLDAGYVTVLDSVNFGTGSFNVVYKNDTDKTLFEIYFQLGAKNHQVNALVLYETERKLVNSCDILTMYNDSTPVAALPSDYTLLTTEFELYCGDLVPAGNNKNLGSTDAKWSNVYATTFTGNLTGNVTGNVTGNCSGSSGSCTGNSATATQFSANKSVTLTGDVTGTASSKAGWSVATTLANSGVTAGTYGPSADVTGNNNATISVPQITVDAKGRVTSVTNRTLTCKNNTYNVYNKTLTIQKNGTNVATFTSNSNTDVTANITVPTKTSQLTNDSGFLTSHQSLSNYVNLNGTQTITGTKTFSAIQYFNEYKLVVKATNQTVGTKPSSNKWNGMAFQDTAGTNTFTIENGHMKNGSTQLNLSCTPNISGAAKEAFLQYYCGTTEGASALNILTASATAPTPATSDNSTKIATTAFVKAQGYLTSHQSLSNYSTLANTVKSLSISGKTITVTPGSGSAYTLTTQDTVYTHPTSAGNKHVPSGGSSGQFLGWASDGTAKWVNNPNTNTDTLMTQNVSTTNATYPVLLVATADATANQGAKTGIFAKSVKVNPKTNVISASGFSGPLTGNVTGNCSGTAANVTGTVAIANGGTGATSRLNAVKALTNENVGTAATYFLGITNSWGKAGYISVADARTVLEIPTFAFQKFAWEQTIKLSTMASFSEWAHISGGFKYTANVSLKAGQLTWIYVYLTTSNDLIKVTISNGYILSGKNCIDDGKNSIKADTTTYGNVLTQTVCGASRLNCLFYPYNSTVTLTMTYTTLAHAGGEDPTLSGKVLIKQ